MTTYRNHGKANAKEKTEVAKEKTMTKEESAKAKEHAIIQLVTYVENQATMLHNVGTTAKITTTITTTTTTTTTITTSKHHINSNLNNNHTTTSKVLAEVKEQANMASTLNNTRSNDHKSSLSHKTTLSLCGMKDQTQCNSRTSTQFQNFNTTRSKVWNSSTTSAIEDGYTCCLLYTSDAADDTPCVDL
eukprot:3785668-Amphidinium_carterae.4